MTNLFRAECKAMSVPHLTSAESVHHSHACRDQDREKPGQAIPIGPGRSTGGLLGGTRLQMLILVSLELLDPRQEVPPRLVEARLREPELSAEFVEVDPRMTAVCGQKKGGEYDVNTTYTKSMLTLSHSRSPR